MECWAYKLLLNNKNWSGWNLNTVECWDRWWWYTILAMIGWNLNTVECWGGVYTYSSKYGESWMKSKHSGMLRFPQEDKELQGLEMKSKHSGMLRYGTVSKFCKLVRWNLNTVECWDSCCKFPSIPAIGWNLNTVECWVVDSLSVASESVDEI